MLQRAKITIHGVVQGVGFRPFVYRLANELEVKGWIINSVQGVFIDAEGSNGSLEKFISRLRTDKPKNSYIQSFEHTYLDPAGRRSSKYARVQTQVLKLHCCLILRYAMTVRDFDLRRRYCPFTNCTNCGQIHHKNRFV
jgi:hydrogenase maturation protein HypF